MITAEWFQVVKAPNGYRAILFISIDQMPFLAPNLVKEHPFFALMITLGFYLNHVEMADQYSARAV